MLCVICYVEICISLNSYAGSIDDPVSLHKYLYANANPVMCSDPSGYASFTELAGTMAMQGALLGMCVFNATNVLRFILGDPSARATYDSVGDAAISGMIDGIIYGAMLGVIGAAFLTLSPLVAIAVAFNLTGAMYYYTLAQNSVRSGQLFEALYYYYMCVFSIVCAGTVVELEACSSNSRGTNTSYSNTTNGNNTSPREFDSDDPLVGELATEIDSRMPGRVVDVNVKAYRDDGTTLTDFDIELTDIVIQVKSGGGKGLVDQLLRTSTGTDKTVIAYGPNIKGTIYKNAVSNGYMVFRNEEELFDYLMGG